MSKPRIAAVILLLAGSGALFALQRRRVKVEISPRPLLYLVADTERELERIPLELTRVSDEEENKIGEEMAGRFGLVPPPEGDAQIRRIREYLNEVGARLAAGVRRKPIRYRFHYVAQDGFVNAAALPGGQIVVGRGLLKLMESEDELAAVLGHEIAHVDRRHAIERLQYEVRGRQLGLGGLYRLGALGVALFQAGYTKEQELEADRVGLGFAVAAGYSPGGAIDIMQRFAKLRPASSNPPPSLVREIAGVPIQALQEYFRSHPPEAERIAAFEAEIAAHKWNAQAARRPLAIRAIFLAERGRELDKRGQFDKAVEAYRQAVAADPNYAPAWQGLARTNWRMGDAKASVNTTTEALEHNSARAETWEWLARALAVTDRRAAPDHFLKLYQALKPRLAGEEFFALQTEISGLKLFAGNTQGLESYGKTVESELPAKIEAMLRRKMAWWMYRAGKLQDAEKELNAALQRYPQDKQIGLDLAWVLTDLGRQHDAKQATDRRYRGDPERGDATALEALIDWRTDQHDAAKNAFRKAAADDPVWMEPHWAENNYSASSAKIFKELRAAEIARRKQEEAIEATRRRSAPAEQANPR